MKLFLLILSILICEFSNAQSINYQWAKRAGGAGDDYGNHTSTDANGNVYVVGHFYSSSIAFGSIVLSNSWSTFYDLYIVKYDPSGTVIWAKGIGGQGDDIARSVAIDFAGNIYIVGDFESPTIGFGSITLTNAATNYDQDIFIAKYDSNGNAIWAKNFGGSTIELGYDVTIDVNNNIYIVGDFRGTTITLGSTTVNGNGVGDILLAKLDASGNVLWAKSAGGSHFDEGRCVFADANGNVFISGSFRSTSITFGSTTLTNSSTNNGRDVFLAKYDSNGNALWAKNGIATGSEYLFGASGDVNGNSFITGMYDSPTITFGSTTLNNANGGSNDIFLIKYDPSGNVVWAKSPGGISDDSGYGVKTDANGNVFLTGTISSSLTKFDTIALTSNGNSDIFLAKYNNNGNVLWAINTGGSDYEQGSSVTVDVNNNIYITGSYRSSPISFGSIGLPNSGNPDMFIAKLCEINTPIITPSGPTSFCEGNSVILDAGTGYSNYLWSNGATTKSIVVTTSGNYSVTITNTVGCTARSNIVNVNVIDIHGFTFTVTNMIVSFTMNDQNYCANNGFLWDYGNGTQNTVALSPTWTYSSPGIYTVCLNCGNTPAQCIPCVNITIPGNYSGGTGVMEVNNENESVIYPNPFSFSTTLHTNIFFKAATLTVYSSFGQKVKQAENLSGQTIIFNRDNLPNGLYFIRITQDNQVILMDKLIITD